jgi:transcriptional regulator with XRE-family HTH domain
MSEIRAELRKDFILKNQQEWAERGKRLKDIRINNEWTISLVANNLGISPGRLKRFEEGMPVMDSKLIEKAYELLVIKWVTSSEISKTLNKFEWGL